MQAWGLLWDFTALRELINTLPGNSTLQNKALTVANAMMNAFRKNDPDSLTAARKLADQVFGEKWEEQGAAIYEHGPKEAQVWGIGHCHIDTAWWEPSPRLLPRRSLTEKAGSGRTASHSKRSHAPGRHRLTSWNATQNTALAPLPHNSSNGSSNCTLRSSSECAKRYSRENFIYLAGRGSRTTRTCPPVRRFHGSSSLASATSSRALGCGAALHGSQIVLASPARCRRSFAARAWITSSRKN